MPRFRAPVLWLAAAFLIAGSAIGFAAAPDIPLELPTGGPDALPTPTLDGTDGATTAKPPKAERSPSVADEDAREPGERRLNHGFYVSQAAHCEDVDDPDTTESPDFTAPEDCEGAGHGGYVSSVAKSSIGKKKK